jgi:hypothetical protein
MFKGYAEWGRKHSLRIKAQGRKRLIWREMLWSLLGWLFVMAGVEVFEHPAHSFSLQSVLVWLIPVPIFLLVGYWRSWCEMEKP